MIDETIYQILAIGLIGSALAISIYHRHQANRAGDEINTREEGGLLLNLRRVFGLLLWFSTLAYLINPGWLAWARMPLPDWSRLAGAALMAACLPLIYWVFSSLGKNVTPTVTIRREHSLVTHGPYRWVRHPLYTVGFMVFCGFALLSANWLTPLILLLGAVVIGQRTHIEEARLIERFGDEYRRYMQATGRYLPQWRGGSRREVKWEG